MKTFQIVFELDNSPEWDADPLSIEFTECVPDDQPPQLGMVARHFGVRQLQIKAETEGKTIAAGDMVRVLIYDLKQPRPLLKPHITTWIIGMGFFGLAMCQTTIRTAQLRPSMN